MEYYVAQDYQVEAIYVIRYQGFNWFSSRNLNYSCKSKEIWGIPYPIFVRGIV